MIVFPLQYPSDLCPVSRRGSCPLSWRRYLEHLCNGERGTLSGSVMSTAEADGKGDCRSYTQKPGVVEQKPFPCLLFHRLGHETNEKLSLDSFLLLFTLSMT